MLDKREVEAEEERLRAEIAQLPDAERKRFYDALRGRIRDPDTYAAANYSMLFGAHHFYLGRWGRGASDLVLSLIGIGLLIAGQTLVGSAILLALMAAELYSLFRSETIVQEYNNGLYRRTLQGLRPAGTARTAPAAPRASA